MITRNEYLNDSTYGAHRKYYMQFVTEDTKNHILRFFTKGELAKALKKDIHLNSIKLSVWDGVVSRRTYSGFVSTLPLNRELIAEAHETITLATLVCVAKEAARDIVEESRKQS